MTPVVPVGNGEFVTLKEAYRVHEVGMPDKTLAQKLAIIAGNRVFIVSAPKGYKLPIGDLPKEE